MKSGKMLIGILLVVILLQSCAELPITTKLPVETETVQTLYTGERELTITQTIASNEMGEDFSITQTIGPTKERDYVSPPLTRPPVEDTSTPHTIVSPEEIEVIRLTYDEEGEGECPVWSPDGTRIAYKNSIYDEEITIANVYVMNIDGSSRKRLTDFSEIGIWHTIDWSPDGEQIALTIGPSIGETWVFPLTIDTFFVKEAEKNPIKIEGLKTIVDFGDETQTRNPEWSPDGKTLLFVYGPAWGYYMPGDEGYIPDKLGILNFDTDEVYYLLEDDSLDVNGPSWSPNGEQIAFVASIDEWETYNIWVMDVKEKNLRQITDFSRDNSPAWSPDGKWIVFDRYDGWNKNLYMVNVETREIVQLTDFEKYSYYADWSPDGKWIAFTSSKDNVYGYPSIYLLDMSWLEMDWELSKHSFDSGE